MPGVVGAPVFGHSVVEVWRGRATTAANLTDLFVARDSLSSFYHHPVQMAVDSAVATFVLNCDPMP